MTLRKQPLAAHTRKHLIHRVEFSSTRRNNVPLSNAPDFLFDYHLPNPHVQRQYGKNIEIVNMDGDHSFSEPSWTRSPDLDVFLSQGLSPILEAFRCDPPLVSLDLACEETLEALKFGINIHLSASEDSHAMV